ncbi:MAG: hypothetical protein NVS4B11_01510 [Ktedonobacteraceae bacterium]
MEDVSSWKDTENEEAYALPEQDTLGILSSTRSVLEQGEYVWIVTNSVEHLSNQWVHELVSTHEQQTPSPPLWNNTYHFYDGTERTVNWLLLLDALNFCFWAEKDRERWRILYKGETLNGYWAEAAALTRAIEEGVPLWDADYLSTISEDAVASIFRPSAGSDPMPLLEQRTLNVREVGRVLQEKYQGQFAQAIKQVNNNAVELVLLLARNLSSFNDVVIYRNREIRFFKRAQICVADIYSSFGGKQWGAFSDLDKLTIFADYKLPQILRHYGVLEYHPALAEVVDNQELLEPGSEEEVEIRAGTIWACELLRRAMQRQGHAMNALEIDQKLWALSQNIEHMRPYHRVRTQYY